MKEKVIHGAKSNGIVKLASSKYRFTYRKKQTNFADFSRSKTINNNKGTLSVKAEYNRWVASLEEDENKHFSQSLYAKKQKDVQLKEYIKVGGEWEKWAKLHYNRGSISNVLHSMQIVRDDTRFCELNISQITKKDCKTFLERVFDERQLKENSLMKVKQALSSVFASRELEMNPTYNINIKDRYKKDNDNKSKKEAILRGKELNVMLKKVKETKDKRFITAVYTALFLCLRRGELYALTTDDIDRAKRIVRINKTIVQVVSTRYVESGTKNSEDRYVPLFTEVEKVLNDYIKYRKDNDYQKYIDENGKEYDFIFANKNGSIPDLDTFTQRFRKITAELIAEGKLKVDRPPTFHSLRGTGISYYALEKKIPIQLLTTMAGHADVNTTLSYYVRTKKEDMMELAKEKLDSSFFDILKDY